MHHKDVTRAINGGRKNIRVRLKMNTILEVRNALIRRGPQYVKKDGCHTIRVGIPGQRGTFKIKCHEIEDIT